MNSVPPRARLLSTISTADRLALLQGRDRLRKWQDINERRTCVCCGRKLTGRLIQIWSDCDQVWFRCPTNGCTGTLSDFARSGDPLFDDEVWEDWCKSFDANAFDERLDQAG